MVNKKDGAGGTGTGSATSSQVKESTDSSTTIEDDEVKGELSFVVDTNRVCVCFIQSWNLSLLLIL
jgi:hypothetical protein